MNLLVFETQMVPLVKLADISSLECRWKFQLDLFKLGPGREKPNGCPASQLMNAILTGPSK